MSSVMLLDRTLPERGGERENDEKRIFRGESKRLYVVLRGCGDRMSLYDERCVE